MRPEDIDKIFRERVGNTSPTPPTDLWNRLQERLEEEKLQATPVVVLQKKEEKRSFMWIYSSVAATLSLLLTVGVVFYNIKSTPEVNQTIAQAEQPVLQETPVVVEPAPETIAQTEPSPEKKSEPQATEDATPASNITEAVAKPATIAKAKRDEQKAQIAKVSVAAQPKANVQQAVAAKTPNEKAVESASAEPTAKPINPVGLAVNSADMNAEPVEIVIKRSVASQTAMAEAESEPSGFNKKATLAKNIFKQVRNLANGEEVELQALGIRADKVALETQIGNKKLSKVINL